MHDYYDCIDTAPAVEVFQFCHFEASLHGHLVIRLPHEGVRVDQRPQIQPCQSVLIRGLGWPVLELALGHFEVATI